MKTTISEYKRGITALHNLMDMLHVALVEVIPSAELARAGAHGWRGYVIRNYENLAHGHFFCQIYATQPTILLMEEFYNYGGFFYPWRIDFELLQTNFFDKDVNRQKAMIVDFYQGAVKEALEWQESAKRQSIVPRTLWAGKDYVTTAQMEYPKSLNAVSRAYVTALAQQNDLLSNLETVIRSQAKSLGIPTPYIKYNTAGWNYRGFWMKLRTDEPEEVTPEGSFPYHFKIDLYDHPELLRYQGEGEEKVLDLAENYFFGLDEENQEATLTEFIKPIMGKIKNSV